MELFSASHTCPMGTQPDVSPGWRYSPSETFANFAESSRGASSSILTCRDLGPAIW